ALRSRLRTTSSEPSTRTSGPLSPNSSPARFRAPNPLQAPPPTPYRRQADRTGTPSSRDVIRAPQGTDTCIRPDFGELPGEVASWRLRRTFDPRRPATPLS